MTDTLQHRTTELVRAPLDHQIADYLLSLLGEARPRRVAQMLDPGGDKYRDLAKSKPFTRAMLQQHAAGGSTYAATLDQNGSSRTGVIEVDQGGQSAVRDTLRAAHQLGLSCYAIAVDNPLNGHSGGHVHFPYDACYPVTDILAQLQQVAAAANLPTDTELWPCAQVIRLPFGYHRWAKTRGELLLQSGEILDLDTELEKGLELILNLNPNAAPPHITKIFPESQPVQGGKLSTLKESPGERAAGRASLDDVKARFNAEHSIESVLDQWGKATETRDGWACACGVGHTHETTLYISKRGKLFSYSPRCHLHTTKGWDAFGLYVFLFHNNNVVAAAKELNPIQPREPRQQPAQQATEYRTAQQDADAERRRAERRAEATATRDKVAALALSDDRLTPCDRATLQAMLDWAAEHHSASCWAGRTTIAQRAGYSLGSVKRSTMLLEHYGYFTSEGSGGAFYQTAKRTFTRGSYFAPETIVNAKDDPRIDPVACEGGLVSPALEIAPIPQQEAPKPIEMQPRAVWSKFGRCHITDGARFGGWSATEAGAWEQWQADRQNVAFSGMSENAPAQQEAQNCTVVSFVCDLPTSGLLPVFDDTAQPEGASYTPVEISPVAYSGITKHTQDTETRYALVWESMKPIHIIDRLNEHVAEQVDYLLEQRAPAKKRAKSDKPRAIDRYLVELAGMSDSELAGEVRKHKATLKKHSGAVWLAGVREKLKLVDQEIDARELHGAGLASAPSQAPAEGRPTYRLQQAFIY
jgi:hypothetical protein